MTTCAYSICKKNRKSQNLIGLFLHSMYILKNNLGLVCNSVANGCGKDAPGNLAHYMVDNTKMHAWKMSAGRFNIGSLDTYYEAVKKYGK